MAISFNQIPNDLRVPLAYVEFDSSRASGSADTPHKILVFGQRLASGSAPAGQPVRITSESQAGNAFGRGSMLAQMLAGVRAANTLTETWAIALDDDGAGVAALGNIDITGTATQAGVLSFYVGGARVRVAVASGDTGAEVAATLAAAIAADDTLAVTAAINGVTDTQVDITCRWKGETGNAIDLRLNYYQGERTPAGLTAAITTMAGGAANPDITTALAAMGDEWWKSVVTPYNDTANLDVLAAELLTRWGPLRMIDGIAYTAFKGTLSAAGTHGNSRNDHLFTCMATNSSPTPPWVWAATYAGAAAASLSIDPARPLQTLPLPRVLPPEVANRWTLEERNLLLFDGISTHTVDTGGRVLIERAITMYQKDPFGVDDTSYLDLTTPATLSAIREATRARIVSKYPRHKLANDGTRVGEGQPVVTPSIARGEILTLFREMEDRGWVENFEQFQKELVVERNADNKNRLDVLMPPDLVNQLRIFAAQIQFIV